MRLRLWEEGAAAHPAHLVKSMTMSARPSCTSVKVSGVTSLQTFKASSMVLLTLAFTSCHGNLIILKGNRHWMRRASAAVP